MTFLSLGLALLLFLSTSRVLAQLDSSLDESLNAPSEPSVTSRNTTYYNPILPGFYPDPSCIFLPSYENTFFCVSSSFNAIPGIPIHASKDLRNWKLVGHVLNRKEQLPRLAETNRSTSGIWAPTLRYHEKSKTFYVITTLVDDHLPQSNSSRWDNIFFQSKDLYRPTAWSKATHFTFEGYDPDLYFEDGKTYLTAAHAWQVDPGIYQTQIDLDTGKIGEWKLIWEGTGGMAPEGPHIYKKDGWYYLLAAEGGTGLQHMVTIARSRNLDGPFESNPANPVLTNANTTSYFQTIGHADLFQDGSGNWWSVALSTRAGPQYLNFPMVRETVLTPVTWKKGEWPVFSKIEGTMSGWAMPREDRSIRGAGQFVDDGDNIYESFFDSNGNLPAHFTYWRYPIPDYFTRGPLNVLRLRPSSNNLTALNGNYAGPAGIALVSRRQSHTLFTYSVDVEWEASKQEEEIGVSAFLTQNHHIDLGVVMLPDSGGKLVPHFRYRGASYIPMPEPIVTPVPAEWNLSSDDLKAKLKLRLEIKASNMTHYAFSAGPVGAESLTKTIAVISNEGVSWGFTGVLLGVYSTSNGGEGNAEAYVSRWRYLPQGQYRD
ncbi:hypothetical protein H1R20_g5997, partial [Candolleomyces eurysporus]